MRPWEDEIYGDVNAPGTYAPPGVDQGAQHWTPPDNWNWNQAAADEARNPFGPQNNAGGGGGGMTEAEGRAYDLAHGYIGGYMGANGWVNGSPSSGGGGGGGFSSSGGRPYGFQSLQWPDWAPPQFSGPAQPFAYQDFKAPTLDDAINEPGYKFAADEGAKRIQNNAAARGNVVSGAAIKDLVKWSNDYATQNYNGVYGRGLQTWQSNRNNAADNYMTNYNVSRDVFDRSYNSYAAGDASRRQKAGLDFQRDWDIYQSDLDTKKYISGLGAN